MSQTNLPTHLGVQLSEFVALRSNRFVGPQCTEFRRLKPDATEDQVTFQIPKGKHLIITDISWYTSGGTPGKCTSILMMEADPGPVVYLTSLAPADGAGIAYKAEHFTAGFHSRKCLFFRWLPTRPAPVPPRRRGSSFRDTWSIAVAATGAAQENLRKSRKGRIPQTLGGSSIFVVIS